MMKSCLAIGHACSNSLVASQTLRPMTHAIHRRQFGERPCSRSHVGFLLGWSSRGPGGIVSREWTWSTFWKDQVEDFDGHVHLFVGS